MTILDKCSAEDLDLTVDRLRGMAADKTTAAAAAISLSKHGAAMRVATAAAAGMRDDANQLNFAADALADIAAIKRRTPA